MIYGANDRTSNVPCELIILQNIETAEGKLTIELLECCFKALPRIQETDAMKGQHLSQQGLPTVERATLTYIMTFLRFSHLRMASGGSAAVGHTRAMKTLFLALAPTKFTEIQAAVGGSGLHARIVDTALTIMQGPAAVDSEVEELAAELVLLVPARLEHLIHILSRMMQAAVRALNGSDHSVNIALRVLDVWVEHFNPEFIERCMSAVMKPLMTALWSHIRPPPRPFGVRVAEMLGKMGGRSRRWLGELSSVEHKSIPEYGLRIVLAFPPNTSFMVPLDRCVQLAWSTMESKTADPHRRKNALQLIQICASTLSKMQLPGDLIEFSQSDLEHVSTKTMHRLISILFGENLPPEIPSALKWPNELGVKTKKQHAAERQMLKAILTAVVTSGAIDMEVEGAGAREFALSTSRHFAFLFAVGWGNTATPPPAPPSSRMDKYDVKGGIPAYVAVLKHLQPQVILDAFEEGLKHADTAARSASVDCLITFLDTLIVLGRAQSQQKLKDLDAKKDSQNSPGWDLNMEPHHNVLQELLRRTMHCCYGDTWPMRLGGIAAIKALLPRLPEQLLGRAATFLLKALFAVLRALPDNAITEAEDVANVLFEVVRLVLKMPVEKKQEHVSPAPTIATKDTAIEEQSAMDVDDDDVQTSNLANKRGKRGKRSSAQSSRKRQHRQNDEPLVHGDISMVSSNPETSVKSIEDKLEPESRRVLRLLLETMVSSKSNDAVRAAVDKGLSLFAESLSVEVGSIVYELLSLPEPSARRDGHSQSRLLVLLERRMLPVRSLIAQTNIAYAAAFALRTCPKQIELSLPSMTFVADCCTIMEADDVNPQHSILGGLTVRGQAVKADNLSKLQIACMEVLVAAIKWPAFQTSKTSDIEPFSDASKLSQQLRDRILKLFIRRLGSSTTRVVDLAAEGIQVVMTKNLVEKEVFHEALRPILVDLAVYQRINMQLLRHVHKLVASNLQFPLLVLRISFFAEITIRAHSLAKFLTLVAIFAGPTFWAI